MCPHWPGDDYEFQFQTGAIKSITGNNQAGVVGRFNSKLVRLKANRDGFASAVWRLFQFQTGAIKSKLGGTRPETYSLFQFQTGAIKSPWEF